MTSKGLSRWIHTHQITTLTPASGVSSLVEAITGECVRGSRWSHPKAHIIYNCYQKLLANKDVLTTKLVAGKTTFIHSSSWPALLGVVLDDRWRVMAMSHLSSDAMMLLEQVESDGVLNLNIAEQAWHDKKPALKSARVVLYMKRVILHLF